jgi:uncharacterized protein (DUF4415 family)
MRGRADLARLRRVTEREIGRTSPPEVADLPDRFWEEANLIVAPLKKAISLRIDQDVLKWFREQGPRYQTRMNAVLRTYVSRARATKSTTRSPSSTTSPRRRKESG